MVWEVVGFGEVIAKFNFVDVFTNFADYDEPNNR